LLPAGPRARPVAEARLQSQRCQQRLVKRERPVEIADTNEDMGKHRRLVGKTIHHTELLDIKRRHAYRILDCHEMAIFIAMKV
jgi:hypothetical protein